MCCIVTNILLAALASCLGLAPQPAAAIDPYQMVSPAYESAAGSGGLFSGVRQIGESLLGGPSYQIAAVPPQLNAPATIASPVVGSPIVQGGPVYNTFGGFDPMFPRLRSQIDTRLYLRGEYLLWDVSGMDSPVLVTTSPTGTAQSDAGVLGNGSTSVLFGGGELNGGTTGGFLFGGGLWITPQQSASIEAEFFQLSEENDRYRGSSGGDVILGRPYFDITNGNEDALLISYPNLVGGDVRVDSSSKLRSYLINARIALCSHGAGCTQCGERDHTDWIIGYRNLRLSDSLQITDSENSLASVPSASYTRSDSFRTKNQFQGLQLGFIHRILLHRAWLESTMRVALGNNEQTLDISGSTTRTQSGATDQFAGGLYAVRSNSGSFQRDEFMMMPELGLRFGYRLTDRLHASIGYSVLYLPNVVRASEQIDRDLNPGLIPVEANPLTGALRPQVLWVQSDYLAHGVHFGAELHF
ncbi:BBP7 family outer membrane beta-barrel protein [Rhodopirellula sp. MGV]|uniref:BBP7 family outer membrane beta-barrel protein n=1 Tax=Rhodopirellula sp. MGV TaxID=2023130 RepID=UPI00117A47E6|nr:BBP7 family outer membrane beta-barrel protein [Rhodopirellula sp. MGV]